MLDPEMTKEHIVSELYAVRLQLSELKTIETDLRKAYNALNDRLPAPVGSNARDVVFTDLFNLNDIQRLQDEFSLATGVASIITLPDGTPITTPSNFCLFCKNIVRKTQQGQANCFKSDAVIGRCSSLGPTIKTCMSGGLWDAGAGISLEGHHVANWLVGQVRDETQTEEKMREYAREIGANEEEAIKAFQEVPAMSRERFGQVAQALHTLANLLSTCAYQNFQQRHLLAERKDAELALRNRKEHLRIIADNTYDFEYWRGPDGKYIWVSPASEKICGYPPEAFIGNGVTRFLSIVHPDDKHIWQKHLNEIDNLHPEHGELELRIIKPTGETVWICHTCKPIFSNDGLNLGRRGCNRDITERKNVQNQLIQTNSRLEESVSMAEALAEKANCANTAKSGFIANMSHEIRTPLNGILGMLQLLETTNPNEEQKEYLLAATISTKRITRLLSDVLDLSRIEAGKLNVKETVFTLGALKDALEELFAAATKGKNIGFEFAFDERVPPLLFGDSDKLLQILFILIGNAIKFTEKGNIRVEFTTLPNNCIGSSRILFAVTDTGVGIPDHVVDNIFETFTQAEETMTKTFQGAGLGLSIVRQLVKLMKGALAVDSTHGKGTTVYLSVPFKLPEALHTDQTVSTQLQIYPLQLRILLAEDDEVNQLTGKRMLENLGCSVMTAKDGQEALKLNAEQKFDLILMDIQMPVLNGVEATKAIRGASNLGAKSRVPIIAMTAYAMAGDKQKFLAAGMDDYISKPVDKAALVEVIERVLRMKGKVQ